MTIRAAPGGAATGGVRPDFARRTALVAGTFYVITFVASIPAAVLLGPVLNNPRYVVSAGADTRVLWGCFLDIVNALACIGTAVTLFPVVKRQNEATALGFVAARLLEAAIILIGVMSLLAVVTLRQDLAGATGANAEALVTPARSLVVVRDWTFLLGPGLMPGINALLLGSLMYSSRLVPRIIPTLGLVGGPLLIAGAITTFFGYTQQVSVWSAIGTLPVAAWELSLALWMIVKGFNPSTILGPPTSPEYAGRPRP
jgi:hypothetical protein